MGSSGYRYPGCCRLLCLHGEQQLLLLSVLHHHLLHVCQLNNTSTSEFSSAIWETFLFVYLLNLKSTHLPSHLSKPVQIHCSLGADAIQQFLPLLHHLLGALLPVLQQQQLLENEQNNDLQQRKLKLELTKCGALKRTEVTKDNKCKLSN